tara:strand:+ start:222 stop:437 length:216 start_codon:yes stop_codon:yes gene_type:complete
MMKKIDVIKSIRLPEGDFTGATTGRILNEPVAGAQNFGALFNQQQDDMLKSYGLAPTTKDVLTSNKQVSGL